VARESSDDLRSPEGQIPYRTEYDLVDVQSGTTTQLTADETSYGTQPLGWPAGSAGFRFARISLDGRWDIAEVAPGEVAPKLILQIPSEYGVRGISLSPDGGYALVDAIKAENSVLSVFDLKTGNEQVFGETPSTGQEYSPFSGLFRPDGQVLLVNQRSSTGKPGSLYAVQMGSTVSPQSVLVSPTTQKDTQLLPVRWSADGQWLVWLGIPNIGTQVYVQRVGGAFVPLPRSDSATSLSIYGFTTP
jgi:hypothetical protein